MIVPGSLRHAVPVSTRLSAILGENQPDSRREWGDYSVRMKRVSPQRMQRRNNEHKEKTQCSLSLLGVLCGESFAPRAANTNFITITPPPRCRVIDHCGGVSQSEPGLPADTRPTASRPERGRSTLYSCWLPHTRCETARLERAPYGNGTPWVSTYSA